MGSSRTSLTTFRYKFALWEHRFESARITDASLPFSDHSPIVTHFTTDDRRFHAVTCIVLQIAHKIRPRYTLLSEGLSAWKHRWGHIKRRNQALIIARSFVANTPTNWTLPSTSLPFTAQWSLHVAPVIVQWSLYVPPVIVQWSLYVPPV